MLIIPKEIVTKSTKNELKFQINLIEELEEKCNKYEKFDIFKSRKILDSSIYGKIGENFSEERPIVAVVIVYEDNVCAISTPEYLSEEQYDIFEDILEDVEPEDLIVVFSEKDLKAIEKYSYGKKANILLAK